MKRKAITLVLALCAVSCSVLSPRATEPTKVFPTYNANLPTDTPLPPTLVPIYTATPTANVNWPVATLTIVASLGTKGSSSAESRAIQNAEKLRLVQANYLACRGKYQLAYQTLNDINKKTMAWDPNLETDNVTTAVEDPSVIAYLGGDTIDAAKLIIPMLEKAGPMVVLSVSNSYPGLTKAGSGVPNEPDIYYPTGVRNFVRVATDDDVEATYAAQYMAQALGVKSVFIIDDEEPYGYALSHAFEAAALVMGMQVVGHEAISPKAKDYQALMWRIAASNNGHAPDAVFASVLAQNNASQLLKDKVTVLGDNTKVKFMGPSGILTPQFIAGAGAATAEGVYAATTRPAIPDGLTDAGKQFVSDYQTNYGPLNEPDAIYAYEAMNVLLKAIENICASGGDPTNRKQVRDALFGVRDFNGVLGTWSFDANGDTSLAKVTMYQVKDGAFEAGK